MKCVFSDQGSRLCDTNDKYHHPLKRRDKLLNDSTANRNTEKNKLNNYSSCLVLQLIQGKTGTQLTDAEKVVQRQ